MTWKLLLLLVLVSAVSCFVMSQQKSSTIKQLFQLVLNQQVQTKQPYVPLKQFAKQKGVYGSEVKLNFHGHSVMAEARRLINVFDNNMFVTAWVSSNLLEAFKYGQAPKPTDQQLKLAIEAIHTHKDRNVKHNSSCMVFWEQSYNKTTNYWESTPENLVRSFKLMDDVPWPVVEAILKRLGLGDLVQEIKSILNNESKFLRAFHIPADFDDTFVNVGLGALLHEMKTDFAGAWKQWQQENTNITSVVDALKKYAYRPFRQDPNVADVDPRTYYVIRHFLDDAKKRGEDIALVPTWIQNIDEVKIDFYKGVGMPFQMNNVDVTVAANTLYGLTSAVLSGLLPIATLEDPDIKQIYLNTSSMIVNELNHNLTNRPDLALVYYPSQLEFDWFVARTLALLETEKRENPLPSPVLETVYQMLKSVTEGAMTKSILSQAQPEVPDKFYFDDFLGDGDFTHDNRTFTRGEDRIFTTAMAANALTYTWTVFDPKTKQLAWKNDTPVEVQTVADGAVQWLTQHTLDGNFDPWNAFFSGSGKSFNSLPFWYPGNKLEYLNGTAVSDWSHIPKDTFRYCVQGHIDPIQYQKMLQQPHFGVRTPTTFDGYNAYDGYFPFWSSDAYTYSTVMLALARSSNIAT